MRTRLLSRGTDDAIRGWELQEVSGLSYGFLFLAERENHCPSIL